MPARANLLYLCEHPNGISDHHGILTQFTLDREVIFGLLTMFIDASTDEFTLVNNAIPSYDIAFEHSLALVAA